LWPQTRTYTTPWDTIAYLASEGMRASLLRCQIAVFDYPTRLPADPLEHRD
jgi:hypothetical protein